MKPLYYSTIALTLALASCSGEPDALIGPGEFCFKRHTIDSSGSGADGVHLADINADQYPDVVSGWEESAELKLYLHPGETVASGQATWLNFDISGGMDVSAIEDAAFIDLDGDGQVDSVVSATEGKGDDSNRRIRLHTPVGSAGGKATPDEIAQATWTGNVLFSDEPTDRFMKVRGAQIDGRHGADIVALSRDLYENPEDPDQITTPGGVFLYTAPAVAKINNPAAWQRRRLADVHKGKSIELLDMDADNDLDILFSGARNIVWLENPLLEGVGDNWKSHWIGSASDLALCDINADGHMDIVGTASRKEYPIIAHWFQGIENKKIRHRPWRAHDITMSNALPERFYRPNNYAIKSIACARLDPAANSNSPADIVITTSGSGFGIVQLSAPQPFRGNYKQPWRATPLTNYQWIMKYDNIIAADMDADGDTDLITSEENEGLLLRGAGVLWYENQPCSDTPG